MGKRIPRLAGNGIRLRKTAHSFKELAFGANG